MMSITLLPIAPRLQNPGVGFEIGAEIHFHDPVDSFAIGHVEPAFCNIGVMPQQDLVRCHLFDHKDNICRSKPMAVRQCDATRFPFASLWARLCDKDSFEWIA